MIHENAESIKVTDAYKLKEQYKDRLSGKLNGTKQTDLKIMEDVKGIKNGKVVK